MLTSIAFLFESNIYQFLMFYMDYLLFTNTFTTYISELKYALIC